MNALLLALGRSPALYRPWLRYVLAVGDTALVSGVVFVFGAPVLALMYLLVIAPYGFERSRSLGYVTTGASVLGYLAACAAHNASLPDAPVPLSQVLLGAALLVVVAWQLVRLPSRLIARIRRTGDRLGWVERGDLSARAEAPHAEAPHADELGLLERRLNGVLDDLQRLVEATQREAEELSTLATQVHSATAGLQRRAVEVSGSANTLSDELQAQQQRAAVGVRMGHDARRTADAARRTADVTAADAHVVDDVAGESRAAIEKAAQALVRVGSDVTVTATTVRALQPASEQVGKFVDTVSRIARQTNMLALNAAIEASRAGEEGLGFAVVADEIRALSVESALAAKRVAAIVQRVRDDIDAAVVAMDSTAHEVRGAGSIANDATRALSSMVEGIARITRQSDEVAALAQTQAQLSASVATAFEALDLSAQRAASGARSTVDGAAAQRASIDALARNAQQLSQVAERLRAAAQRRAEAFPDA